MKILNFVDRINVDTLQDDNVDTLQDDNVDKG